MSYTHLFDYVEGDLVWKNPHKKAQRFKGRIAGCINSDGYRQIRINSGFFLAHNIIWEMHYGAIPDGYFVDHADTNTLNNSLSNLRLATASQNQHNKNRQVNNTSGVKGVTWHKGKWQVQIGHKNKQRKYGRFDDLELATLVAAEVRAKLHGEFANDG